MQTNCGGPPKRGMSTEGAIWLVARTHRAWWAQRVPALGATDVAAEQVDGTPEARMFAHRMVATTHARLGQFAEARSHFGLAMGLVDCEKRGELSEQFGFDPGIATLYHFGLTFAFKDTWGKASR